jgi:acetyltransferase-like isoleucine patch superfamily enzyme
MWPLRKSKAAQPLTLRERRPDWDVGRGTYGIPHVHDWGEGAKLKIGAFCSIADGVQIFLGGEHRMDWVTTYPFSVMWPGGKHLRGHPASKGNVTIGNDVWIAREAMIISGVNVGDGAVIGARAVVSKDVEPYAVVAGNPARVLKYRFEPVIVEQLLALRWWEWDDARIQAHLPLMLNGDVLAFLAAASAKP